MILRHHGQAFLRGVEAGALGNRPALEDPFELEPEVVVQPGGRVLLHDEGAPVCRLLLTARLGGLSEVALAVILAQPHDLHHNGLEEPDVITGFNTDVKYRGLVYHVQTEDKGEINPIIETLIYKGGEILGSRRLPYKGIVPEKDEATLLHMMEDQHKAMILEVKRGKFDPSGDRTMIEDLSLDDLVLAYLAQRAANALPKP
jgi:hypothetical protein